MTEDEADVDGGRYEELTAAVRAAMQRSRDEAERAALLADTLVSACWSLPQLCWCWRARLVG